MSLPARAREPSREAREGSVLGGAVVALLMGAFLFWIPVFGPVVAGFFGGRIAGSPSRGLVAALLPAALVAGLAALVALALPLVGPALALLVGGAVLAWAAAQSLLVVLGALLGGWYDLARERRGGLVLDTRGAP